MHEVAKDLPGVRLSPSAEEILRDPSIDIVSIASYDKFHRDQVVLGLEQGKHLFVEKPLCTSETELAAIVAARKRFPELRISSNLILRRYPRFADLKKRIQEGELGRIYDLEADYNYGRIEKLHQGWRGEAGYSVVLGGGIHMVDLVQWLSAERITEVSAFANRACSEGSSFSGNDMVTSIVRFESGAVGKINANFGCVFPHMHRLAIYGTKGTFLNDLPAAGFVRHRTEPGTLEPSPLPYPGAEKSALLHDFIDSIVQGREPEISFADIVSCVAVCLAIEKSVTEGRMVRVALPL
jgi:predicted dehydrogenase